jgi:hypothetical protein
VQAGKLAVRETLESMALLEIMDVAMVAAEEWQISAGMEGRLGVEAVVEEFMLASKIIQVDAEPGAKFGFLVGR